MAYAKLLKVCQDYAVGFRTINQAIDNNTALRDLYDAKHGLLEPASGFGGSGRSRWDIAGVHDDVHVDRSVAHVSVTSQGGVVTGAFTFRGAAFTGLARGGVGQWILDISGLATWWARAHCEGDGSQPQRVTVYRVIPSTGQHLLYVSTWQLDTGDFVLTDVDFCVTVMGTR